MKTKKVKKISLEDLHEEINGLRNEISNLLKETVDVIDRRFLVVENKIGAMDIGLTQKINGLAN